MGLEDFNMEIKYGKGLEFETDGKSGGEATSSLFSKEQEEALKVIIREGFRAPVGAEDKVSLMIGEKSYPVFNLSVSGVGILFKELHDFKNHSIIKGMILKINGDAFKIDGQVMHVSQDEAQYLCGIHIITMDDSCRKELFTFLQKCRNSLFS
jgi:hypothetical protein